MTIKDLIDANCFKLLNQGEDLEQQITKAFCCDLLSFAMTKTPAGAAWVTVMGNVNTLAVSSLTEAACVILAEGAVMDEVGLNKAKQEGITVFATEDPIFETALMIHEMITG